MTISLACQDGDHTACLRRTCTCHCTHPGALTDEERAAADEYRSLRDVAAAAPRVDGGGFCDPTGGVPEVYEVPITPAPDPPAPRKRVTSGRPLQRPARSRPAAPRGGGRTGEAPARRKPRVVFDVDEARRLYVDDGHGLTFLADRYGCSPGTVARHLRLAGVPIRAQGDRSKPLDVDELVRRYDAGESSEVIAADLGVAAKTVTARLKAAGRVMRGHRVTFDVEEAVRRYVDGLESTDDLAPSLGVSHQALRRVLRERGVLRPRGTKPRGVRRLEVDVDQAARLYETMSALDVGRQLGVSEVTVLARLREAGVPIRAQGTRSRRAA